MTSKNGCEGDYSYYDPLCYNLPVRPPLYNNLFGLKFETGPNFLKSMKTILYTWANKISRHSKSSLETGALLPQLQAFVCTFNVRNKQKTTEYS